MNRDEANLVAFTRDAKVHHAPSALHVAQPRAELFAVNAMIERGRE